MYIIKKIVAVILCTVLFAGCEYLDSGLKEYDLPDDYVRMAAVEAENTVEKMAQQENVPPSLSDDFMERYLDMSSFEELKQRTLDGIRITNDLSDMSEAEIALWEQIVKSADFNQYTTSDLERRKAELLGILESLAREHDMTTAEFLRNGDLGIDLQSAEDFLERQAEKYASDFEKKREEGIPDISGKTDFPEYSTDSASPFADKNSIVGSIESGTPYSDITDDSSTE